MVRKLGDIVSFKTGKLDSNAAKANGLYPFFTCSPQTLLTNTYSFDEECVLLAGNNANGIYPLKYFSGKFDAYQRTYIIRSLDTTLLLNRYLYYALRPQLERLKSISTGAATKFLTLTLLNGLDVDVPSIVIQERIVNVLAPYDDLIEHNTRRIKILEEMAQALYREWFVHFRFLGNENVKLVDSSVGAVPQGWEVKRVKDVVKRLTAGQVYTEKTVATSGRFPVVDQSRDDVLGYHNNEPDHTATPDSPVIAFGDHTCKMQLMVEPFSVGPNVVPFVSQNRIPILYLYLNLRNLVETREYKRHWTELAAKHIVLAPNYLAERFAKLATPMFEQMDALRRVNLNLRRTRDLLLPKLITGEVDVMSVRSSEC